MSITPPKKGEQTDPIDRVRDSALDNYVPTHIIHFESLLKMMFSSSHLKISLYREEIIVESVVPVRFEKGSVMSFHLHQLVRKRVNDVRSICANIPIYVT